jgi:hypothetical protein
MRCCVSSLQGQGVGSPHSKSHVFIQEGLKVSKEQVSRRGVGGEKVAQGTPGKKTQADFPKD